MEEVQIFRIVKFKGCVGNKTSLIKWIRVNFYKVIIVLVIGT